MATYRVTRKVGVGALFESYVGAVRRGSVEHPVWLRRLIPPWSQDAGFIERFAPLAEQWRALSHEGIARLGEFGNGADSMWVTQHLHDGETVRTLLSALSAKQVRPQMNEVVAIGIRVASALAVIHEQSMGLQHGDVCASTIHVTMTGVVQLTDFGIATAAGMSPQTGPARSELAAMAPEQQSGKFFATSDVYRLGLVLLELVTGRGTPGGSWPGMPEKLATALSWMLAKDPTQRPPARDVESALQVAAEQSNWSVTSNDVVRFVARLLPDRTPRTAMPLTGGTELNVRAVEPSAAPMAPMLTPPGVTLARISTKKVTPEALAAENERLAAEAAAKMPTVPPWRDTRVADVLIAKQRLSTEQLREAMAHAESVQGSVTDAVMSMSFCDEDFVIGVEAELTKTHAIQGKRLVDSKPPHEVLSRLPAIDAEMLGVVPLGVKSGDQLVIAMRDPLQFETLESVKRLSRAASVLAVRAGPSALARAMSAFYQGVDTEDPSSWLENAGGAPLPSVAGIELDPNAGGMEMELEARGTIATAAKSNATLDDPQVALLNAVLVMLGEKGRHLQQFIALAGGLTRRLGASEADVGKARFSAAAIGLVNAASGQPPWAMVHAEQVHAVCGTGWRSVQELISRALDANKPGPASDATMLALQTTLIVAGAAGSSRPSGQGLANALQAIKSRHFPKVVLDAVTRELS